MKTAKWLLILPFVLFLAAAAWCSVPTKMSYEGRLVNASGNPITTATTVSFSIYDASSGGTVIWGPESQSVTPDSQGVFSVVLGNATAITPAVFNSPARYLEITVGSETLSPRTQLVSSGYSFMSAAAQTVEGGVVNRIVAGTGVGVSGNGSGTVTLTATGTTGGTVTQVGTGTGLTGGPVSTTGTISIDSTVATLTGTQSLTNKTLSGASNTINNLDAGNISSGTLGTARLGSGTASSTTFLRGDQTWAVPGGGGTVTSVDSGAGLTGGPVTGTGTLEVGAGTGITVTANAVGIDNTVVATLSDTQTLTNKTISGASNTLSNINAGNLSSGTVGTARLGSGTADNTTFLRGDQTWATPGGGGTVTTVNTGTGLTGGPVTSTGTISIDSTVATLTGSQTLTNKTISDASNTITLSAGTIPNLDASKIVSGVFSEARGGTNQSTYATGDILYASGTNTLAKLPAGSSGQVLKISGGVPVWGSSGGTGTVTQVDSGTGLTGGPITSAGTLSVNVGTGANQIVQLDSSAKLPAVDGSALTGLTKGQVGLGNVENTALSTWAGSTNLTTLGTITTGTVPVARVSGVSNSATIDATDASNISSGTLGTARLGSGTASSTTFLRGDQTWAVPGGGGTVTSVDSGAGLTGGPVTGSGTLEVGAGTGITVTANAVGIDNTVVATLSDTQTLTNKTISGASNTINNLNAGNISSGTLVEARGGTNQSTYAAGDILYASGANTLAKLPAGANGRVLKITSGVPSWETAGGTGTVTQVDTGTGLTGGPITGTGTISIDATVATLTGTQTLTNKTISDASNTISLSAGTIPNLDASKITTGTMATARLGSGTADNTSFLRGDQTWAVPGGGGTVTSVDSGAGLTGGPVTGSGTLEVGAGTGITVTANAVGIDNTVVATLSDTQTLTNKTISGASNTINNLNAGNISSGTLVEARGGTNQSTYATGDILYASGSNILAKLPVGSAGQFLKATGGIPSWETSTAGTVTQVNTGTGLTGGPVTSTGTISIDATVATLTGTQTLTNKTLTDTLTNIQNNADNTKKVQFDASGGPAGETRTWTAGSGIPQNIQVFTSSGNWTRPTGVSKVYVQVWGGGGGAVTASSNTTSGGGGGGGGYCAGLVTVSGNVTVTVGAGGTAGATNTATAGGNSSFAGDVTLTANGGSPGSTQTGGAGGTASGGTINLTGGAGGDAKASRGSSGGTGGGSPMGGAGGAGAPGSNANGTSIAGKVGTAPGGGGGGGQEPAGVGGNGAAGLVIVSY